MAASRTAALTAARTARVALAALVGAALAAGCGGAAPSATVSSSGPATTTARRSASVTAAQATRRRATRRRATRTQATDAPATRTRSTGTPTTATTARATRPRRRRPPAWRRALPNPRDGTLPQTAAVPSSHTVTFAVEMRVLWEAIRSGHWREAMPAFFPEAAYAQLKSIGDPELDWSGRLVGDYALDIAAAHALLGAGARSALLEAIDVPAAGIKYVAPGICDNSLGYEEVPNTRIVYRSGGVLRSFGIASLISWRGLWYVVHLGAVVRSAAIGIVDDPSDGAGISAPSTTC